jgi:hypothetical protein
MLIDIMAPGPAEFAVTARKGKTVAATMAIIDEIIRSPLTRTRTAPTGDVVDSPQPSPLQMPPTRVSAAPTNNPLQRTLSWQAQTAGIVAARSATTTIAANIPFVASPNARSKAQLLSALAALETQQAYINRARTLDLKAELQSPTAADFPR